MNTGLDGDFAAISKNKVMGTETYAYTCITMPWGPVIVNYREATDHEPVTAKL